MNLHGGGRLVAARSACWRWSCSDVAVGTGSTPVDDWFTRAGDDHPVLGGCCSSPNARVMLVILVVCRRGGAVPATLAARGGDRA